MALVQVAKTWWQHGRLCWIFEGPRHRTPCSKTCKAVRHLLRRSQVPRTEPSSMISTFALFVAQSMPSGLLVLDFEMFPHWNSQKLPGHFLTSTWVAPVRLVLLFTIFDFVSPSKLPQKDSKTSPPKKKKNLSENKTSGSQTLTLSLLQEF